jgi:rhodanese-related sulfurtransferase
MRPFGSKHNGRELVAKGALLLDVRSPEEFHDRHLDGAVNIPVRRANPFALPLAPTAR